MATPPPANASKSQQDKLKQEGNALVQKQQFEQAASIYTLSLEADSTSEAAAAIFSNRSLCFLNTKKFNEALQDAEKAISLRPTWHRGYQRAAAACEKLEKCEEGLKHLEKCFELDDATRNDSALKQMKQDLEINIIKNKAPSMTQDDLKQIGNNFVKNEQYENAIIIYTLAIEKDAFCDEAAPILSNRSLCYYNIGKYKEAYEDAGCCCGIKPAWAKGFARRGFAAEKLKEWKIALESYDEYLKLDPADGMGAQPHQVQVKKIIDSMKRDARQYQLQLRQTEKMLVEAAETKELKKTTMSRAFHVLLEGCANMSIEMIELGVKYGGDLSMPFLIDYCCRFPNEVAIAKKKLAEDINDPTVQLPAEFALRSLKRTTFDPKYSDFDTTTLLVKQRNFLDRLLDIIEKQENAYTARSVTLHDMLIVCAYDEVRPIRKDLVLILLEKGKKFFIGANKSDRDWRRLLLTGVLCGPAAVQRIDDKMNIYGYDRRLMSATAEVCRSVRESVQLLLEGLTAHDLNNIPECVAAESGTEHLRYLPLQTAVSFCHHPSVLQHLIDAGATANEDVLLRADGGKALDERRVHTEMLQLSIVHGTLANSRILLKNGALLQAEDLPKWAVKAVRDEQQQFPNKPIMGVSEKQCTIFQSIINPENSAVDSVNNASEETLRLIFDVLTDQNFSVYLACSKCPCCAATKCHTPLTRAMNALFSVDFLRTLIKIRPKLLHSPRFDKIQNNDRITVTVTYPFGQLVENCVLQYDIMPADWFLATAKILLEEEGLNYYTTVAVRRPYVGGTCLLNVTAHQLVMSAISSYNGIKDPKIVNLLRQLNTFCEDFETKRQEWEE